MSQRGRALPPQGRLAETRALVLFALVAGWKGDRLHPQCCDRGREARASDTDLPAPKRSRRRVGRRAGARAPDLDGVQLRWREALVRLSWSSLRSEGSSPLRSGPLLPVPSLLRSGLRKSAGERDAPCSSPGADNPGAPWREREHDEALPGEAQGDAP